MLKRTALILIVVTVALGACSAANVGDTFRAAGEPPAPLGVEAPAEVMEEAEFAADEASGVASGVPQASERIVIKNANLSVVVEDPGESMEAIARMAEGMGGFVVSSNLFQTTTETGLEVPRASITVRVPADQLTDALSRIEELGSRVLSRNESGEDVTREYTDLQSRLRNLEQAESQLREIMDEATETEDVLSVFNQLTQIREQIEVIQGQIQYFEQSAAFSAVSVDLVADAAVQPLTVGGWEPVGVAKDALQALIDTGQFLVNALIWIVLYIGPVALLLLIPLRLLWVGFRRWRARRRERREEAAAEAPSEEE